MRQLKSKIKNLREDFNKHKINFKKLPKDPLTLFSKWMEQALKKNKEAIAFVLSQSAYAIFLVFAAKLLVKNELGS